MQFSKPVKNSPTTLWDNELEFNQWLEDNIDYLNDTLNTAFTVIEREKSTPTGFSIDLAIEDDDSGRKGVIECQMDQSDHDHLGKLLTYSTAFESEICVWIVKEPQYEHQLTVEWLNEVTDKYFYLTKIESVEIDGSKAPLFTPISVPSPAAKEIGEEKHEPNERDLKQERFWDGLLERSSGEFNLFSTISAKQQGWISKGAGRSGVYYRYRIRNEWGDVGLYIDTQDKELNEEIFDELREDAEEIESQFGDELKWERLEDSRACRISKRVSDSGLNHEEQWEDIYNKMIDGMKSLSEAFDGRIESLTV